MEPVREQWTDERLGDMRDRMNAGFDRLDADLRELRSEMRSDMNGFRSDMQSEFAAVRNEMSSRFEATQRLIIQVGAGMFGTMAVGFIGLLVAHA
jgi:hypothetical protein